MFWNNIVVLYLLIALSNTSRMMNFFYQKMNLQFAVILLSYDYILWGLSQSQLSWQWRYSNFVNLQKRLQKFDSKKRMYTKEYIRAITNMPTVFVVFYEVVNRGIFKCFNVTIDKQRPTCQIWPAHYFCLASGNKKCFYQRNITILFEASKTFYIC